jgi:outer membrane receptor protein involved in Fe transport
MNSGEIISLSVFYKMFHNPIERTFNTEAANPELTLRNVDEASLYGLEIEFRKNLDFAQITKDFKVGLNLTLVKSQVSIDSKELELKRHFDPSFSNTRVMFGQSPYIVNAHLGYSNEKNGISANLAYNISGERLYLVNATGVPDVYETPRGQMDFNISKTFAQKYSLKLSAKNLLDSPYKQTYEYGGKEYVFSNYSLGRTFSFSISYSF